MTRITFCILLLAATPTSVIARPQDSNTLVVSGTVRSSNARDTLAQVRVSTVGDEARAPATTDSDGIFELRLYGVTAGASVRLRFEKPGFRTKDLNEVASPEKPLEILLDPLPGSDRGERAIGKNGKPTLPSNDITSPIEGLAKLGWTVQPGDSDVQFGIVGKPLPDMEASARYFRALHEPFRVHLQLVKGIAGLHLLADVGDCKKIEINAVDSEDLSELRGFAQLSSLEISQVPFNNLSTVDLAPIASLTSLRELYLNSTRVIDLAPLAQLKHLATLNLKDTLIRDLSPIRSLTSLESVDITGTHVNDLSPLTRDESLRELGVGGRQLADLTKLKDLTNLENLRIIEQGTIDLGTVGELTNLKTLFIWGPPTLNLSPLGSLTELRKLQVSGLGMGLSVVTGADALQNLKNLNTLSLAYMTLGDLSFVAGLTRLRDLSIAMMPVSSIDPVRGLTSLETVALNHTNVVDISPLLGLPELQTVSVQGSPVRSDVLTELERRGVKVNR